MVSSRLSVRTAPNMMNDTSTLDGYTPSIDATIVTTSAVLLHALVKAPAVACVHICFPSPARQAKWPGEPG